MNTLDSPDARGRRRASEDIKEKSISCRDVTAAELKSMRLSGCRTRHQSYEQDTMSSSAARLGRPRSSSSALETSLAILDRMAQDTAAATLRSESVRGSHVTPSGDTTDRFETFILTSREASKPNPFNANNGGEVPKNLVEISHRNHDFQHILSLAEKEALLKLNVRQFDDDDEDEEALYAPQSMSETRTQRLDSSTNSTFRRRGNEPIGVWKFPSLGCAKETTSEESASHSSTLNNRTGATVAYSQQVDGKLSSSKQGDKNEKELTRTGNSSLGDEIEKLQEGATSTAPAPERVTPLMTTNLGAKKVEHDFGFTRNMELVYAAHVKNIFKLLPNQRSASDVNRSRMSSNSGSQKMGKSFGYYSFGCRVSLRHPNRLSIKETPQLLSTSNVHGMVGTPERSTSSENATACDEVPLALRDTAFVARVKANPLLQTTVFCEHLFHTLQCSIVTSPNGAAASRFNALQLVVPSCGADLTDAMSNAANTEETTESTPRSDAPSPSPVKGSRESQSGPTANLPKRYYRTLTPATRLVRHVHSIDNFEREVDNETNDLVVYVGMRLMGWLEVVSLLGQGGFGQAFLCRDLRISDGHFVHPKDIDSEDFAYWNCSHAYLPFGEAGLPPTSEALVAVKVVKSLPLFESQSVLEAEMLVLLGGQTADVADRADEKKREETENAPPAPDPRCRYIATVLADGICYGHHCIVMDRYGANLYEYFAKDHKGIPMYQIRSIGQQLFSALSLLHQCHIIHADIKPENILLTLDSCRSCVSTNYISETKQAAAVSTPAAKSSNPLAPPSLESSYIALQGANTPAELPVLHNVVANETDAGKSISHLITSQCTTSLEVPQPRRVHPLNQRSDRQQAKVSRMEEAQGSSTPARATCAPALEIKLIDFSSSCYEGGPLHTYIQSRYYRAPEAILQSGYGAPIDMWSAGCVLAELLLGLPLLPGCNEHHQLTLIEEAIGPIPDYLLDKGKSTTRFYAPVSPGAPPTTDPEKAVDAAAAPTATQRRFQLRTHDDFLAREDLTKDTKYQHYFAYTAMRDLIRHCPLSQEEKRMSFGLPPYSTEDEDLSAAHCAPSQAVRTELLQQRFLLYDLLRALLNPDPSLRPTPEQVLKHTFFASDIAYEKQFSLS